MWERKKRFEKDISDKEGSIGKVLKDNRDMLMESKSTEELWSKLDTLLRESCIDTPKSRQILIKLKGKRLADALIYIQNVLFASMGMGTY